MSSDTPNPDAAPQRKRDRTMEFDFVLEAPRETHLPRSPRPAAKNASSGASVATQPGTRRADAPRKAATSAPQQAAATAPAQPASTSTTARRPTGDAATPTRQESPTMPTTSTPAPVRRSSGTATTSRPSTSSGGSTRNPSVSDFRRNAERQQREQKAAGNILSWVGYSLLGGLVLVAGLAAFGGYTLLGMIEKQAVTVAQLDALYRAEFDSMRQEMATQTAVFDQELAQLQEELAAADRLAAKQQETIKALTASMEKADKDTADALATLTENLETEAGRRWKGDKDLKGSTYSLDKRLDAVEYQLRRLRD